jgi:hypothetical protein
MVAFGIRGDPLQRVDLAEPNVELVAAELLDRLCGAMSKVPRVGRGSLASER